jgi:hypothetical protein
MHWHGLLQKDTPWFDGVPSVTQCPVSSPMTLGHGAIADSENRLHRELPSPTVSVRISSARPGTTRIIQLNTQTASSEL